MLATRIIPTLLIRGTALYKGERFQSWRQVGHAMQAIRTYQTRGVDELMLLDIAATPEGRGPDIGMVEQLSAECFMPLTVGGGVRSVEDVKALLDAGADKVCIGTAALLNHTLVKDAAGLFGSQAIVVSIDADEFYEPCFNCGKESHGYGLSVFDYAYDCERRGVGEILLTRIDRDGTLQGYDLDLIRSVSSAVSIPVIASGGCSGPEDMLKAIQAGASAVAAGALFTFTDTTPKDCAKYLSENGVEVRL